MQMESIQGAKPYKPRLKREPDAKPEPVTDVERQAVLRREQRTEQKSQAHPTPEVQTFSEYSQNNTSEAAMLCNELLRFQKNGMAGEEGIRQYRTRLGEIREYLGQLEGYRKKIEGSHAFDPRDMARLREAAARNKEMVKRIDATLAESAKIETGDTSLPYATRQKAGAPEPASPWAQAQKPKDQPAQKQGFFSRIKSFFSRG